MRNSEMRDLLPVGGNNGRGYRGMDERSPYDGQFGHGMSKWNWSFIIPIGLLMAIGVTNIGLNAATFSMVYDQKNATSGPQMLFGLDTKIATMKPKGDGCEITVTSPTTTNTQIYQFVDRPYRGMSKTLTATEFAKLWEKDDGKNSFHDDPPNTAVKQGTKIGFNTVEITDVTYTESKLTLTLRKPTSNWGGPNADNFCTSTALIATTPGALSLFVDSACQKKCTSITKNGCCQ